MIETAILSFLIGIVSGAALCNFIKENKKFRRLKLSGSNIEVIVFDKEFAPEYNDTNKHYIGVHKDGKVIAGLALNDEGVTDVKLDVEA